MSIVLGQKIEYNSMMNYKKLPNLVIKNPLTKPEFKEKVDVIWLASKVIFITLIILVLTLGSYYYVIRAESSLMIEKRVQLEQNKAYKLEPGIVLDTTAKLISQEGNISIDVASKYAEWIYDASVKYAVDPILILSVMAVESNFNYLAISPTGPVGLLQVASSWHKDKTTRGALFDPKNNIMVGTQILKEYGERTTNPVSLLLMYNGSLGKAPVYATKVLSKKRYYEATILKAITDA